jgi:ATP-dependent Clp protease ATP-binding subunit ClpX
MTANLKALYFCNFCGKNQTQVKKMVAGHNSTYICSDCVLLCVDAITEKKSDVMTSPSADELNPPKIMEYLDQFVIGQNNAKKTIAVAIYNHLKRIKNPIIDGVTIDKSNIIMVGSSGTGKSHMVKTLAKILNVPFAVVDATSLSQTGYVGLDPEECLARLYQAAENDLASAEKGIVFVDEIDKIGRKSENVSTTRDVSGEGVQQALLKIIEGSDVKFSPMGGRKNPNGEFVTMNTNNVLFIMGGAFEGIDKIISERIGKNDESSIGFMTPIVTKEDEEKTRNELLAQIQTEDLISFGMIPELVGRIPVTVTLDDLDHATLRRILVEPKNAIVKQFQKLFELDAVELEFEDLALDAVASQVLSTKTGARGLRSVIEKTLMDSQFNLPLLRQNGIKKIIVSEDNVVNKTPPKKMLTNS